jgi:hypothetical protein
MLHLHGFENAQLGALGHRLAHGHDHCTTLAGMGPAAFSGAAALDTLFQHQKYLNS